MDHQRTFFDDEFHADMEAKRRATLSTPCQEILLRITGRWASAIELSECAPQYESHICKLRECGYKIQTQRSDGGWWDYRLQEDE